LDHTSGQNETHTPQWPFRIAGHRGEDGVQTGMGGMLGNFLNSGFGRAIEMGAGFGIGDELIKKIF